jgi:hypothetical protein
MPAPADDHVRPRARQQQARVAQDAIYRVGDALRVVQFDAAVLVHLAMDVEDVAQHGEQVLLDAADHATVDERRRGGVVQLELDAPGLAHDADLEVRVAVEDRARVVGLSAAVQHRKGATPVELVQAAARRIEQPVDFLLREVFEAARRRDACIDEIGFLRRACRDRDFSPPHGQGLISIGTPTEVRSHTSTMSAFVSAMQPSVQSRLA